MDEKILEDAWTISMQPMSKEPEAVANHDSEPVPPQLCHCGDQAIVFVMHSQGVIPMCFECAYGGVKKEDGND